MQSAYLISTNHVTANDNALQSKNTEIHYVEPCLRYFVTDPQ